MTGVARDEHLERQARVRDLARHAGLAAVVAVGRAFYDRPGPAAYLCGQFPPFPAAVFDGPFRGLGHAAFVLPLDGPTVLIADRGGEGAAADEVVLAPDLARGLAAALERGGVRGGRVGLAGDDLIPAASMRDLARLAPGIEWVPCDDLLWRLRVVKSAAELALLRDAAAVADAGLAAALPQVRHGATEREVAVAGIGAAMRAGADFVRYLRVHAGAESAIGSRWPPATDRAMVKGDLVTLDIIGARGGYGFDVLRTAAVGFDLAPEARRLCEAVARALAAALAAVRAGVAVDVVVRPALAALDDAGLGPRAGRVIGHGIGLETVEPPYLVAGEATVLRPGMVLCVEPSAAIPGLGGSSIEEEVIVTPDGGEVITRTARRLWE